VPASSCGAPVNDRLRLPPLVPSALVVPAYGSCTGTPAAVFSTITLGITSSVVSVGEFRPNPARYVVVPVFETVTVRGALTVTRPEVSVTAAVIWWEPLKDGASGSRVFHGTEYGSVVSGAPTRTPSTRKATLATPRSSVAVAETVTVPPTVAASAGALNALVGGAVLSTVMLTGAEVVTLPASSVARTVTDRVPLATAPEFQSIWYGAVAAVPTTEPSTRNCTAVTLPSSAAAAASRTVEPLTRAPEPGADRATCGPSAVPSSWYVMVSLGRRFDEPLKSSRP
jgi:hypothetical protein